MQSTTAGECQFAAGAPWYFKPSVARIADDVWREQPNARRGEVWQIDFGLAAKVRPALVLGCDVADEDRVLVAVVYHTTALRGSRYEVPMNVPGVDAGGFDTQSIYTVPAVKLIRRRAILSAAQLKQVEEKLKLWLGLA